MSSDHHFLSNRSLCSDPVCVCLCFSYYYFAVFSTFLGINLSGSGSRVGASVQFVKGMSLDCRLSQPTELHPGHHLCPMIRSEGVS